MQSDLADIVWTIADRIGTILGFEDCVIYLRDGDKLVQYAAYGEKKFGEREIKSRIEIPMGQGVVGSVARSGVAEIVADTSKDPRYIWDQFSGLSELTVPMIFEGQVIGIIDSEAAIVNAFASSDLELMQQLANIAAPRIASELAKQHITRAEIELRRSEDELQRILESVSDGILTIDKLGIVRSFNSAAERMFKRSRIDVMGQHYRMLVPEAEYPGYRARLLALLDGKPASGSLKDVEVKGRRADGTEFPMEVSISNSTSLTGPEFVVASVRDISSRKAVQDALHYRLGFENLIAGISANFIDLPAANINEGIDDALRRIGEFANADNAYVARFHDDNSRFSRSHDWCSSSLRQRIAELQNLEASQFSWWMSKLLAGTPVAIDELSMLPDEASSERSKLESVGIRSIVEVPMYSQGVVTGFLGLSMVRTQRSWTSDDIALLELTGQIVTNALTRKETDEELLKSRAAAQAASNAKSQFLANMSHELRTPLNAIIGYSELLRMEADSTTQQSLIEDLDNIHQAGRHLLALITDVLDLAKVESGHTDFDIQWFAVADLVADVKATSAPLMTGNKNDFRVVCDPAVGDMHSDRTRVQQVLLNLLSNAAKFTARGQVSLEVSRVHSGGTDHIRFAVTDTGIGIEPDKVAQIFAEFVQADTSTTREYGGTGLGLAISRRICLHMGGDIELASTPGEGSRFTAILPVRFPSAHPGDVDAVPA
jgi:PAS domain S-box-containing protein